MESTGKNTRGKIAAKAPRWILNTYRWLYFTLWDLKYEIPALLRKLGFPDKKFNKLKELKNKYEGKRCFIIATGPSLKISDLEMLKEEYTFGVNSICLLGDKTEWRPNFYCVSDSQLFEKIGDEIHKSDYEKMFFPDIYKDRYSYKDEWIKYPCNFTYSLFEQTLHPFSYKMKFSNNCYSQVFDGGTVLYTVMQLAIYMGFKELYLLGTDCNYKGKKQHFIEGGVEPELSKADEIYNNMINSYKYAKKFADKNGVKIVNCTRGGMLEVFPRRALEDALAEKNSN